MLWIREQRLSWALILGPKGKPEDWKKYSLEIVANRLAELTNYDVLLVEVPTSDAPKALLQTLRPNQLVMLENLRFEPERKLILNSCRENF